MKVSYWYISNHLLLLIRPFLVPCSLFKCEVDYLFLVIYSKICYLFGGYQDIIAFDIQKIHSNWIRWCSQQEMRCCCCCCRFWRRSIGTYYIDCYFFKNMLFILTFSRKEAFSIQNIIQTSYVYVANNNFDVAVLTQTY